jgi:hypothetical protein
MKQLKEMSRDDLEELEYRLEYASKQALDKHKRWEATQKLKLVRRELERRRGMGGFLNRVKDWLMPDK